MRNEEANNVKKVASTFLTKRGKKVASTFLGPLLVFLPSFFNHLCEAFDVSPATCPTVKLGVEAGRPTGESRYPASRIPWIPAFAGKTNLLPNTGYRLLMLLWPVTCFLLPVTSHAADLFPGRGSFKSASSASAALPVKTSSIITLLTPADGATGVSQSPSLNVAGNYLAGMGVQYHFQVNTAADMTSPQGDFDQTGAQLFASSGAFSGQNATISSANDAYSAVSTATFVYYSSSSVKLSANTQYYWRARVKPSGGSYSNWSSTASFTTGQFASVSPVNHLAIGGVNLFGATDNGQMSIGFTIAENNVTTGTSTNGGAYNTADWIFVKFSTAAGADGSWNHATLTGGTVGAGATLAAASDNKGVYVNHTTNSAYWTAGATITWNAAADGIFTTPTIVKVFAVSMVKVPTGNFIYNVSNIGGSTFSNYNSGTQATITGPGTATGTGTNNLPLNAPVGWPNGYNSFYIGRYEITQGQYADFLNTIPSGLASTLHFTSVANGHNMTNTGTYPTKYAAADSNAAKNFLSFDDGWRYLSWAGLRPPTEMEFEKAGRDLSPDARIYPWGSTPVPDLVTYTPPSEGGTCIKKFLNYNNTTGCTKVLDVGRYMSGDVYRTLAETGASPWGIADLAGNVWELSINSSWATVPLNGNGTPTLPASWPVPGATTAGIRGGGWNNVAADVRVSARFVAGWAVTDRGSNVGARPARTP